MIAMCRRVSLAFMVLASSAYAADPEGTYRYWGAGGVTCKAYAPMAEAQNADFDKVSLWVAGYLTAYNRLSDKTYDIVEKNSNISTVMLRLLNYCNKNPNEVLNAAIKTFTDDNNDKRMIEHP
jgi:hypothetical protein